MRAQASRSGSIGLPFSATPPAVNTPRPPHPAPTKLLLIGLRGSGKTTLARGLAARQGLAWIDLDELTPRELGCSTVAEAWARAGEKGFRDAESRALRAALGGDAAIISLGGGTPTAPGGARQIEAACDDRLAVAAYLRCTPQELRGRLELAHAAGAPAAAARPSLTGRGVLEEIEDVFRARDPLYQSLATRVIEGLRSIEDGVMALESWRTWT